MEETRIEIILYTTSTCPECERAARVLDALGIPYVMKAIDLDPEAQTDALMLKITKVPAVEIGGRVLRVVYLVNVAVRVHNWVPIRRGGYDRRKRFKAGIPRHPWKFTTIQQVERGIEAPCRQIHE